MNLIFSNSNLTGYNCEYCNGYNDVLRTICVYCNAYSEFSDEFQLVQSLTKISRSGEFYFMTNDDRYELHAKFFAEERLAIRDLSDAEMIERREEYHKIAFEARAKMGAIDAEERERNASKSIKAKQWLISPNHPDINVTDAINNVKERKARQTKADKMLSQLSFLGIAGADKLVAQIAAKESGRAITSAPTSAKGPSEKKDSKPQTTSAFCLNNGHHNCDGSFKIGNSEAIKCDCKCHKPKVTFNPANVFGRK